MAVCGSVRFGTVWCGTGQYGTVPFFCLVASPVVGCGVCCVVDGGKKSALWLKEKPPCFVNPSHYCNTGTTLITSDCIPKCGCGSNRSMWRCVGGVGMLVGEDH